MATVSRSRLRHALDDIICNKKKFLYTRFETSCLIFVGCIIVSDISTEMYEADEFRALNMNTIKYTYEPSYSEIHIPLPSHLPLLIPSLPPETNLSLKWGRCSTKLKQPFDSKSPSEFNNWMILTELIIP